MSYPYQDMRVEDRITALLKERYSTYANDSQGSCANTADSAFGIVAMCLMHCSNSAILMEVS